MKQPPKDDDIVLVLYYSHLTVLKWLLQGWPRFQPDILVSTPAALLNYLFDFDPEKKRRATFLRDIRSVVR